MRGYADMPDPALFLRFDETFVDVVFLVITPGDAVQLIYVDIIGLEIFESGIEVFFELFSGRGLCL